MLRPRRIWVCLALAMGWGVSVAAQQNDAATYPDPVAEVIRHSVVRIGNARSSGTGFLVSDQGHVVTAWHVLNGINRGGGSISYMRSRFWIDFAGPETNPDDYCRVRANLIGVSEYRDVAMLRIRQEDWLRRSDPDYCLSRVKPVTINWHLDEETGTTRSDYPFIEEDHYPIGFPARCAEGTGGEECELSGFDAFRTGVRKGEDEIGLLQLSEQVELGFSGGPVVLKDGRVVGMTILRDWEGKNAVTLIVPSPLLEAPLWTFGVSVDKRKGVLSDHHQAMLDYISRKPEIDYALTAFEQMYDFLSVPALLRDESEFSRFKTRRGRWVFEPQFTFRRRWPEARNPTRFDVSHSCVPTDPDLLNVLFLPSVVQLIDRERASRASDLQYSMQAPPVTEGAADRGPTDGMRYKLQIYGVDSDYPVDLKKLVHECERLYEKVLNITIGKYRDDPENVEFYLVKNDGEEGLTPAGEAVKSYAENGLPGLGDPDDYNEIVFTITAVFAQGDKRDKRHDYEKVALSLDPVKESANVR